MSIPLETERRDVVVLGLLTVFFEANKDTAPLNMSRQLPIEAYVSSISSALHNLRSWQRDVLTLRKTDAPEGRGVVFLSEAMASRGAVIAWA
jgi:hypothetical protein